MTSGALVISRIQLAEARSFVEVLSYELSLADVGASGEAPFAIGVVVEELDDGATCIGGGVGGAQVVGVDVAGGGGSASCLDGGEEGVTGEDVVGTCCTSD